MHVCVPAFRKGRSLQEGEMEGVCVYYVCACVCNRDREGEGGGGSSPTPHVRASTASNSGRVVLAQA